MDETVWKLDHKAIDHLKNRLGDEWLGKLVEISAIEGDLLVVDKIEYVKLFKVYDQKRKQSEPGIFEKAGKLAMAGMAAGAKVLSGQRLAVPDTVLKDRLNICKACEHYKPADGNVGERCLKCGCYLNSKILAKARWSTESCPVGKWGTWTENHTSCIGNDVVEVETLEEATVISKATFEEAKAMSERIEAEYKSKLGNILEGQFVRVTVHGGLGDVLLDWFGTGSYDRVQRLKPNEKAEVYVFCHNPGGSEMFRYGPPGKRLCTHRCEWNGLKDEEKCVSAFGGIRHNHDYQIPLIPQEPVFFYYSQADSEVLDGLFSDGKKVVAIAAEAGDRNRDIPDWILEQIIARLVGDGYTPAVLGRTYYRTQNVSGKALPVGCIDLRDKLSGPGACEVVRRASGLVCSHSSLNICAGFTRTPQWCLWPFFLRSIHFSRPARWSFWMNYPETINCAFEQYTPGTINQFLKLLR